MGMVQKQAGGEDWQGDLVKCLPFKEEDLNPIPSKDVKRWAWVTCVPQSQWDSGERSLEPPWPASLA